MKERKHDEKRARMRTDEKNYRRKLNERRRTKERGGSARRGERGRECGVPLTFLCLWACYFHFLARLQFAWEPRSTLIKPWQFGNAIFFSCGSWRVFVLVLVSLLFARHTRHTSSLQNGGDSTRQKSEGRWYWSSIRDGGAKFSSCSSRGFCTWCWREFISRVDG